MKRSRQRGQEEDEEEPCTWPSPDEASVDPSCSAGPVHFVPHLLSDVGFGGRKQPVEESVARPSSAPMAASRPPMIYWSASSGATSPPPPPPPRCPPPRSPAPPPYPPGLHAKALVAAVRPSPGRPECSQESHVSDKAFAGSHAVAVLHAPWWAWTTSIVHLGSRAKWDDVKRFVVEQNNALPGLGKPPPQGRMEHWQYRLVTQTTGRALQWARPAKATPDSMVTLEYSISVPGGSGGVWGAVGDDSRSVFSREYTDVSTVVLVPSERFLHH